MSLLRLLSVGRSLGRISDPPNRYRMTQQSLLPKFGGARKADDPPSSNRGRESEPERGSLWKRILKAVAGRKTAKYASNMNRTETDVPVVTPQAFPRGRWTFLRGASTCVQKPKVADAPVQGELSLDMVRPVRNDLRESDLEVTRTVRPASVSSLETSPVETGGINANRDQTQLSEVGKT